MADKYGNKTGGRKKGTPNKVKSKTKAFLKNLIEGNYDKIKLELSLLSGKQYFDALNNLMSYVEPKLSSVEYTSDYEDNSNKIDLSKLDEQTIRKLIKSSEDN